MLRFDHHQPLKGQPVDGGCHRKTRDIQLVTELRLVDQRARLQCAAQNGITQMVVDLLGLGQTLRGISIRTAPAQGARWRAVDFSLCPHVAHQFSDFYK